MQESCIGHAGAGFFKGEKYGKILSALLFEQRQLHIHSTSDGGILIDAGVSAKRITGALENIGVSPDSISAIFITHEHSDHINGLRVFAGSRNIDVYASAGTLRRSTP